MLLHLTWWDSLLFIADVYGATSQQPPIKDSMLQKALETKIVLIQKKTSASKIITRVSVWVSASFYTFSWQSSKGVMSFLNNSVSDALKMSLWHDSYFSISWNITRMFCQKTRQCLSKKKMYVLFLTRHTEHFLAHWDGLLQVIIHSNISITRQVFTEQGSMNCSHWFCKAIEKSTGGARKQLCTHY